MASDPGPLMISVSPKDGSPARFSAAACAGHHGPSLPGTFSFITMTPIRDIPEIGAVALALKLALDVVGSVAGGTLEIVSAWEE